MTKNIVVCADGTGNSFQRRPSNVARLVKLLSLDKRDEQVVVYDQGIGTDSRRWQEIEAFGRTIQDPCALRVLRGPHQSLWPVEFVALMRGLAFGYGLNANVRQSYEVLANLYRDGDRVFLFGFSRGAFTVRALAALIYRCGLPRQGHSDFTRLFEHAWRLFVPMKPNEAATKLFRAIEGQRDCTIHFLGIWDTVKSYGGFRPVMLPHLRHNPIVTIVRHALALDEERGWFDATTWGRLDRDKKKKAAWSRLSAREKKRISNHQEIEEVWFRGCHADIGGGIAEERTATIALRWMLGEAACAGIRLNAEGVRLLQATNECELAEIHESHTWWWRLLELAPRNTIDNSRKWPKTKRARTGSAPRSPELALRDGKFSVHESVGAIAGVSNIRVVSTRRRDSPRRSA